MEDALNTYKSIMAKKRNSWFCMLQSIILKFNLGVHGILLTKKEIIKKLHEYFIADWENKLASNIGITGGNKLRFYRQFKEIFAWEFYLSWLNDSNYRVALTRLRTSCHNLAIELGRHQRPPVPENERLCHFCTMNSKDNELHFLLHCSYTDNLRKCMFDKVESISPNFRLIK